MPYIKQPKWATISERAVLISAYALLNLAAWLAMTATLTPHWFLFGAVQSICSLSAVFGIATGRYRWEWVVLPTLIAIQLISAILLVNLITQFFIVYMLAVAFFLGRRFIHLTVVAKLLRERS